MDSPTAGEPYRSPTAVIELVNGHKYWCHVDGDCRLLSQNASHAPEGRATEYKWFTKGWMRVTISGFCIYIEGGDLGEVNTVVRRNHWHRSDREIRVDITPNRRITHKYGYREGWVRS